MLTHIPKSDIFRAYLNPSRPALLGNDGGIVMLASRRLSYAIRCLCTLYALSFLACGNTERNFLYQVINGNRGTVKYLLQQGADPNTRNPDDGSPALTLAVAGNDIQMAMVLIKNGADVNAKGRDGQTPLMHAAQGTLGLDDMVRLLIARGADVNIKTRTGDTALGIAERMGNEHIVELLRAAGALE